MGLSPLNASLVLDSLAIQPKASPNIPLESGDIAILEKITIV
jgi:hypothetical protein